MLNSLLALAALAPLLGGTVEDGQAWLQKVEERMYAWPKPGSTVRFQVRTDMLDTALDLLSKEIEARPDETTAKAIEAMRRMTIKAQVDTSNGNVSVDIDVPFETDDPARKAGIDKMKQGITTVVSKSFQGLPLGDASMLGKNMTVLGCEERDGIVTVRVGGVRAGDETKIRIDRARLLPESFENTNYTMQMTFSEVLPRKFAPTRLEIQAKGQPKTSADYSYQRVGDLVFPSSVKVVSGDQRATLRFESVSVKPLAKPAKQ